MFHDVVKRRVFLAPFRREITFEVSYSVRIGEECLKRARGSESLDSDPEPVSIFRLPTVERRNDSIFEATSYCETLAIVIGARLFRNCDGDGIAAREDSRRNGKTGRT